MAHIPRIFVNTDLSETTGPFQVSDGHANYLSRVLRLSAGASVRVFNGRDGEWSCSLSTVGKKNFLEPVALLRLQVSLKELHLLFAPIKKTRTDFICEKASELGVTDLHPVITEFTQFSKIRRDKLQNTTVEAAEQTERMDLPVVHEPVALDRALSSWDVSKQLLYCDEAGGSKPLATQLTDSEFEPAGFLIGPEGGFSPKEQEYLRSLDFVTPVTLGPRILRAETAVVSALTLWQALVGDWNDGTYIPTNRSIT